VETDKDRTKPSITGFDVGPLRKWFLSQLAAPPPLGAPDVVRNEYARPDR
jgi:hypothetical protein